MDISPLFILFFKGTIIGFAIAAPVGPIGILCIRRVLSHHVLLASLTAMGSACADAFYAIVAVFSLAGIADFITKQDFYLRLFGGGLVAWIGFSILKNHSLTETKKMGGKESYVHAFSSSFLLTLSNPVTLIVFAAAFAAMGIAPLSHRSISQSLVLVVGVFAGAVCWWGFLMTMIHLMKHKLSSTQLVWINRFSGVILIGFSVYILTSLI